MKYYITIFILFSIFGKSISQVNITDEKIVSSSDLKNINFAAASPIIKLSYSVKKFLTGRQGIEFSVLVSTEKDTPIVNLDSVILTSANYKFLSIHHPYFDTTESLIDMNSSSYNTVHWLSDSDIKFLQNETITQITVFLNKMPFAIKPNKKSQTELKKFAKSNF